MALETRSERVVLAANAVETPIISLSPPEGEKFNIVQVSINMANTGKVIGYLEEAKVDVIRNSFGVTNGVQIKKNYSLSPGVELVYVATDESGTSNATEVMIEFDRVTA